MCDPVTAAMVSTGLQVATQYQAYQSQKAIAQGKLKANEQSRKNSDQAYLYDIQKIDSEMVLANREKTAADFEANQKTNKDTAAGLNLNAGNAGKIVQDLAGVRDLAFLDVTRDFETDMFQLSSKEIEAYSAQSRRYNSIIDPVMPSSTGLMLQIGTSLATGYTNVKAAQALSPTGSGIFDKYGYQSTTGVSP